MRIPVIRPDWPAPANIRALSTLRAGGVSAGVYRSLNLGDHVGDELDSVLENRRRLRSAHDLPSEPRWLRQVHGIAVADLDMPDPAANGERAKVSSADAAFSRQTGVVCAILTADCLPVLLTDIAGETVAAAHAGWRGLASGVLEATVAALGQDPSRLLAWLGPGIGPRRFEVGAEVRDAYLDIDQGDVKAFIPGAGRRFLADLPLLARQRLTRLGVSRVYEAGECTHSSPERFFSHRRDGVSGRHATLIWRI
jgi:YfiH family protein